MERGDSSSKSIHDVLDTRLAQCQRVITALAGVPHERQMSILLMWMDVDTVDEMLEALESRGR